MLEVRAARTDDQRKKIKVGKLPVFTHSGIFSRREKAGIVSHSGFVVGDFDHLKSKGIDPASFRDQLAKDQHVYVSTLSPGGDGVKVLIRIEPNAEHHEASFKRVKDYFFETYGQEMDPSGKDCSRACFGCWDPEIKINPDAIILHWQRFNFSANGDSEHAPPSETPQWPPDSVIEDFVALARERSESEDTILIGCFLPLVAALLARRVYSQFVHLTFPNIYNIVVTKPGLRKSTTINMVEYLGRQLLPQHALIKGATSEQALFKSYRKHPDKLWVESEGNVILANWGHDAAGKIVAKRVIDLHDCCAWQQNYIRQEDEGEADQIIPVTSTSLLIGSTLNSARFNGLADPDGMRRRFSYYISERLARTILWPENYHNMDQLIDSLGPLRELQGEMRLSTAARKRWDPIQIENRSQLNALPSMVNETLGNALASYPIKILKTAMLFEVCRWAKDPTHNWQTIQPETIELAAQHQTSCLRAQAKLDTIAARAEIQNEGDAILAQIRGGRCGPAEPDGNFLLTRTQLTLKFACHPGRYGAMTPMRLFTTIIPDLIRRGFAVLACKQGKKEIYAFRYEE